MQENAAAYAARGWLPLPLIPGEKRPWGRAWQHTTRETWRAHWAAAPAGAGLGLLTGPASGLVVVDLDRPKAGEADALTWWSAQEAQHGASAAPTVCTGSGGRHLYFAWEDDLPRALQRNSARFLRSPEGRPISLDIRSGGGQVVAPPTAVNGRAYAWAPGTKGLPLPPVPTWLVEAFQAPEADDNTPPAAEPEEDPDATLEALLAEPPRPPLQLGDPVRLAAATYELDRRLVALVLRHAPAQSACPAWMGRLNNLKALVRGLPAAEQAAYYDLQDRLWSQRAARGYDAARNRAIWHELTGADGDFRVLLAEARPALEADPRLQRLPRLAEEPAAAEEAPGGVPPILDPATVFAFEDYISAAYRNRPHTLAELQADLVRCVARVGEQGSRTWYVRSQKTPGARPVLVEAPRLYAEGDQDSYSVRDAPPTTLRKLLSHQETRDLITFRARDVAPYPPGRPPADPERVVFNLFPGWGCLPVPNDPLVRPFERHIHEVWCAGDPALTEYVLNWLAHLLQRPAEKCGTALVVRSRQGAGKNIVADWFGEQLLGRPLYLCTPEVDQVLGRFNDSLVGRKLVVLNEAAIGGDAAGWRLYNDRLKTRVTDTILQVETKGRPHYQVQDYASYMVFSNHDEPVRVASDDRRYVCLDCASHRCGDRAYFDELVAGLYREGAAPAVMDWLLRRDLAGWDRRPPATPMRQELQGLGAPVAERFLQELREAHPLPYQVGCGELYARYLTWAATAGERHVLSQQRFGTSLQRHPGVERLRPRMAGGQRQWVYRIAAAP